VSSKGPGKTGKGGSERERGKRTKKTRTPPEKGVRAHLEEKRPTNAALRKGRDARGKAAGGGYREEGSH